MIIQDQALESIILQKASGMLQSGLLLNFVSTPSLFLGIFQLKARLTSLWYAVIIVAVVCTRSNGHQR